MDASGKVGRNTEAPMAPVIPSSSMMSEITLVADLAMNNAAAFRVRESDR